MRNMTELYDLIWDTSRDPIERQLAMNRYDALRYEAVGGKDVPLDAATSTLIFDLERARHVH